MKIFYLGVYENTEKKLEICFVEKILDTVM